MTGAGCLWREAKENAKGIDAVAGGFQGARPIAAEGGLRKGRDEIEGLGIDAVAEGETVSARHGSGLRDQPQGEGVGFVESDGCGWW